MSIFVIVLGSLIMLWAIVNGEIAIWGGSVDRSESPVLFWMAFALCAVIVIGFIYLEITVDYF
jgi:hypothetical protein